MSATMKNLDAWKTVHQELSAMMAKLTDSIYGDDADRARYMLDDMRLAMMAEIIRIHAGVSGERAIALTQMYSDMCDSYGCPLTTEEAAFAMVSLIAQDEKDYGEDITDYSLQHLRDELVVLANRSFGNAITDDQAAMDAIAADDEANCYVED